MEVFKTVASIDNDPEFTFVLWGASQTEAAKHRKGFKADMPEAVITSTTFNVPTSKGPLVEWLNANAHA